MKILPIWKLELLIQEKEFIFLMIMEQKLIKQDGFKIKDTGII